MKIILLALGLSLLIELITIYLRLVVHRRSAPIQKKLHLPRIHHSYPGLAIILLDYVYLNNEWFFIIGFALIFSDLVHHLIFEPFIKKRGYDIGGKHHRRAHTYVAQLPSAIALVGISIFALITPFTPGSWLSIVGIGMLAGKDPKDMLAKMKRFVRKR